MSKALRAEEHRVFAEWVDEHARDELAGIRAYHLAHAAQLLVELATVLDLVSHAGADELAIVGKRLVTDIDPLHRAEVTAGKALSH